MTPMRSQGTCAAVAAALALAALPGSAAAATIWAVGDGALAGDADDQVAAMIDGQQVDAFLFLGDVYDSGTAAEFALDYEPGYGRLKSVTRPTPGNHEWDNRIVGYDPYWGSAYTTPHYYSFDLGDWHLIALSSQEAHAEGSNQLGWLRSEVAGRSGTCTLAYLHRPRYSAGSHGDQADVAPLWEALAGRASVVLAGHDHNYQRLGPIDGITSWVVGTGGAGHYALDPADPRLAFSDASNDGALRLSLSAGRADYAFVTTGGATLDSGSLACDSGSAPADTTAPVLDAVSLGRRNLRLRRGGRALHRSVIFRYRLSEAAEVAFRIKRRSSGRRVGDRCRRVTAKRRGGRRCLRYTRVGSFTRAGVAGLNRTTFRAKVGGRRLRPGFYRAYLVATDAAGNASATRRASFRVLRPR